MKALNEIEWGEFLINDLFTVSIGQNIDGNKVDKINGMTAYITRKETNNALDGFVDADISLLNNQYPVITIGNETAEPFVQTYKFYTGTKVNILEAKKELSKHVLLFISMCLKMHKNKYSYSYTINSTRLKKQKILLPITQKGDPDYAYMEAYMCEKERLLIERYRAYSSQLVDNQDNKRGGG